MPLRSAPGRLIVVGSGPSAVACAWALAARGFRPLVVDAGRRLEPEREHALRSALGPDGVDSSFVDELVPLYGEPQPLEATGQTEALLRKLRENSGDLRRAGVAWGRSRLAVSVGRTRIGEPCRYSGLCMYGCPYGSIYNAAATLRKL